MSTPVISLGVTWFRAFTLAYTDGYGNLVLEIDGLPDVGANVNLCKIFPAHVIYELMNCEICYTDVDGSHRRLSAFREWFCSSANPRREPCLCVKLTQDREGIILYRNDRARVPEWCEGIRLLRACDSDVLIDLPLIKIVHVASHR